MNSFDDIKRFAEDLVPDRASPQRASSLADLLKRLESAGQELLPERVSRKIQGTDDAPDGDCEETK